MRSLEMQAKRLRWLPEKSSPNCAISKDGRGVSAPSYRWRATRGQWIAGCVLPTEGCVQWTVRIERCFQNLGRLNIGVCTADGTCGWGVYGYFGRLSRWCMVEGEGVDLDAPPPETYPDGDGLQVFGEDELKHHAEGASINCILDADSGCLSFEVFHASGRRVHSLKRVRGFPPRCVLRPWAWLYNEEDALTLSPTYQRCIPPWRRTDEDCKLN